MSLPSIGDILMLSQTAWKIGRAFTAGLSNIPSKFQEVEVEINALAKALKLLAETMFAEEDGLLGQADQNTQDGFATIINSCQQTIGDLDSLIDQYQSTKKTQTGAGFTIERSWSDLMIAQYQTMIWTTDGGNINHLQHLLKTYMSAMSLIKQALQSKSLSRLKDVISPMAEYVDNIRHRTSSLGHQLEQATRIVQEISQEASQSSLSSSPPGPWPLQIDTPQHAQTNHDFFSAREFFPQRYGSKYSRAPNSSLLRQPEAGYWPVLSTTLAEPSIRSSEPSSNSTVRQRVSSLAETSRTQDSSDFASSDDESSIPSANPQRLSYQSSRSPSFTLNDPESRELFSNQDSVILSSKLLPSAMDLPIHHGELETRMSDLNIHPVLRDDITQLHRSGTTMSQKDRFEKSALRNAAVLCDVRGTAVEYAHKISADEDSHEVEMITACQDCRIAVVRKREASADAKQDIRIMTSIWVFSDDNALRMELKMADGEMYVPYSSYFNPEKVSVTVPCELKFHDVQHGQRVLQTEKTTWITYTLDSDHSAALFQNELMGRTLLRTFRTAKTLRIHEGLSGTFSYASQMCGMENLRIWEDNETLAVIALIHFSPQFRNGYLAFYLNSSNSPIRVKDEGGREVKVKGLRVPLEKGALRKDSIVEGDGKGKGRKEKGDHVVVDKKKVITGARIEFASEGEKRGFLALVWQVQGCMRELPSLAGVN